MQRPSINLPVPGLALAAVTLCWLALAGTARAEETLGCPLGLDEGQWWYRSAITIQPIGEKYDRATGEMGDMPDGWEKDIVMNSYRLGHSPVDRWEFGVLFKTKSVDSTSQSNGEVVSFRKHSLSETWLSAGYMLIQDEERFGFDNVNAKVGVAFKPGDWNGLTDADIKHGLGTADDAVNIGILTNEHWGRWECCNHLIYQLRGNAAEVNGFSYSGMDLPDRLNYKLNFGYGLGGDEGEWAVNAGLFGWMDLAENEFAASAAGKGFDGEKGYLHRIACGLEYSPNGEEHNTMKLAYSRPLDVKMPMAPEQIVTLVYMFTFD